MSKPLLKEKPFSRWGLLGGLHYLFWRVYYRCHYWLKFKIWWGDCAKSDEKRSS